MPRHALALVAVVAVVALVALALPVRAQTPPANDAPAPAPDAPATDAPATDAAATDAAATDAPAAATDAPAADAPAPATSAVSEDPCLALVKAGKKAEARACYRKRADDSTADDGALARELADLVGGLKLEDPADLTAPPPPGSLDLGELVASGKAELVGMSTLAGAYAGVLTFTTLLFAASSSGGDNATSALYLLSPVAGGALGLGISSAAVILIPDFTAGDANAVRALITLGSANSVLFLVDYVSLVGSPPSGSSGAFLPFTMSAMVVGGAGLGAVLAVATDMPEGAGSMAISGALWLSVLTLLGADMAQAFKTDLRNVAPLLTATTNAGFALGMVGAHLAPMTRAETWAVDVGGGVGLLAGASVAFFANMPNPFLGYGTMLVGTSAGMAAGFATARFLPQAWSALPDVVAAPLVLPSVDGTTVAYGGAVTGRF